MVVFDVSFLLLGRCNLDTHRFCIQNKWLVKNQKVITVDYSHSICCRIFNNPTSTRCTCARPAVVDAIKRRRCKDHVSPLTFFYILRRRKKSAYINRDSSAYKVEDRIPILSKNIYIPRMVYKILALCILY